MARPVEPAAKRHTAAVHASHSPPMASSTAGDVDPPVHIVASGVAASDDQASGRRIMVLTLIGAAVAAAILEWAGWQIVHRATDATRGQPSSVFAEVGSAFALGVARNFVGTVGVGAGFALLWRLMPIARRRRAIAIAFACGTAVAVGALSALTAWAP
jgi:hypothetical protein